MILVDTSVWIDHLRAGDEAVAALLNRGEVVMHPFVLGELACGNLQQRGELLALFRDLPQVTLARDDEVLFFIDRHALMGRGIGYLDAHLLAAVALNRGARLWTRDKRLHVLADEMDMAYASA